jgi:hypothetical protein
MAINTRVAYIYDSNLVLEKQGKLTLDSETGIYAFTEEEAQIQQGEVGTVQLVIMLPNGTLTTGTPLVSFRTKTGYGSSLLQMSTAENWQITVDEVTNTYQTLYLTLNTVGWTYHAGRHALQAVWLYTTGELEKIPMVFFTVQDGVNNYEELTADTYEEMAVAFDSAYEDLLDRVSSLEAFNLNALGFNNLLTQTGAPLLRLYNVDGNAILYYDGTNILLNRNSVDEEILTALNKLSDFSDTYYGEHSFTDKDILAYSLVNNRWQPMTKAEFQAITSNLNLASNKIINLANGENSGDAVNKGQLDLKEDKSNKVTSIVVGNDNTKYVGAYALYEKFLTKVATDFTIAGLPLTGSGITLADLKVAIGVATTSVNGLMSSTDKTNLDGLMALFGEDADAVVNKISEVLTAFDGFPETTDLMAYFATKVDKEEGKGLSENDLTDALKLEYDAAVVHANKTDGTNPHATTYANVVDKPTNFEGFGLANGSVETIEATTNVTTPKVTLASGVYIEYNAVDDSIDFVFPE